MTAMPILAMKADLQPAVQLAFSFSNKLLASTSLQFPDAGRDCMLFQLRAPQTWAAPRPFSGLLQRYMASGKRAWRSPDCAAALLFFEPRYSGEVKSQKEELAETQFDSLEAMIDAYAAEAVRVAASAHRVKLDFSVGSVAVLERILADQNAVDLEYQTRTWGSYFGELLRRRWGGDWSLTQYPNAVAAVPTLEIAGSRLYPLMKVYRRLTMGEAENLPGFLELVQRRLEDGPQVH